MAADYQIGANATGWFNQLLTPSPDQEDRAVFLTVETSITIRATADAVWEFAYQPANWTASNPTEHFGLRFDSPDNLPDTGVTFVQHESVAGMRAALRGRFHYMDRPRLAFWTGTAAYRFLGGLLTIRLPEGGVLRLNEGPDGVELSHDVYIDFPDSWRGRLYRWVFERLRNGRQAVHDHTYRELRYFKEQLEATSGAGTV